jgi:RND family efflux transporter MFP subunit
MLPPAPERSLATMTRKMIVLSCAFVGATVLTACGQSAAPVKVAPPPAPLTVSAAAAHRGDIQQTLAYSGEIRAREQISVLPKASGRIQQVLVDTGSHVKAGDAIAVLDQDNPQMQILQARAGLAQAQARLASLQAGPRSEDVVAAQAGLAQQQLRLANMRSGGRPEDVKTAEAQLTAAQARLQALMNGADDGVRQAAQSAVDADKDALASAQAAFAALGAQNATNLQGAQSQVDTLQAQIQSAQSQIDAADAALANVSGASAADVQAAQSAYDEAYSQLQTAQAALKQNYNPPQAAIAQAQAAFQAAQGQRAAAEAQQTALEQRAPQTACWDAPGAPHNSTACNSAKAAASASVTAADAAVEAAHGQLDLLKRGGTPSQQTQLQAAADQAQAQVNTAKARLDALTNGGVAAERAQAIAQKQQAQGVLAQAQAGLQTAEASLSSLKSGALDAQVKAAQAQVTAAGERLKTDQARMDVTQRGATDEDIQQAQAAVDQAQQQLVKARHPYTASDLQQQEQAVTAAAAQLQKAQNPYTDQDVAAAQAAVDGAQAQLDSAELALSETTVSAPVDGIVAERQVAPGALVSPQTPLVTLVPPSVEVVVNVDEGHLSQMGIGEPVQLQVAAYPDRSFDGAVTSISPMLDSKSRTAAVHIQPRDSGTQLRAGMFAQLRVVTSQRHDTLMVPVAALNTTNGQSSVVVIDDTNTVRLQPVRTGIQNTTDAEILSGLTDDQLVATSGVANLHDGDVVAPHLDNLVTASTIVQ